jgi:hypothetical protein
MIYAIATVADLDIPAWQWIRTEPLDSIRTRSSHDNEHREYKEENDDEKKVIWDWVSETVVRRKGDTSR